MIILEGNNIEILKMDYDKGCIEVLDVDNNILYIGTDIFDVIREREKPIQVKLYHYTVEMTGNKHMEDVLVENEWLKKSIKRQQLSNEECSKYIGEVVKENEQLKKDVKYWKQVASQYSSG